MTEETAEVIVVGGGPAGLTAAIAIASAGIATALVAKPPQPDNRTTALLAGSVAALDVLGVWERCRSEAAPLRAIRLIDATSRLIRAPEVLFSAAEIGEDAFGYNVENRHLLAALETRAQQIPALVRIGSGAEAIELTDDEVIVRLSGGGTVRAPLALGADGRHSLCRAAAGIAVDRHAYPQRALTLNLSHRRPHNDVSTEFHTESGPFTLVPLPGLRSSVVCVVTPAEAERLAALGDGALSEEMERRSHSILGHLSVEPGRGLFPLAVETARSAGARRIALIGEAAHVIPPIGAQGLNLGLRDAATISELVAGAHRANGDVGAPDLIARYNRLRQADVMSRTFAVDLLNRTLLSDFLPVQGARGLGLCLVDRIGPLRRALMREGISPAAASPRLMRGEAI